MGTSIESEREEAVTALCSFRCEGGGRVKCADRQQGTIQLYSRRGSRETYILHRNTSRGVCV